MLIGGGGWVGRGRSKTGDAIGKVKAVPQTLQYVKDLSGVEVSPVPHGTPGSPDLHLCITQLAPLYKAGLPRAGVCPRVLGCGGSILPVQSRTLSAESLIARVHCLYLILSRVPCSICSRRTKLGKAGSTSLPMGWGQLAYKPRMASLSREPTTTTRPTRCRRRPAPPRR